MSEAKITPLARRLAEENGIDWRQLPGTGPDGTVVERDILAFLAKVMAGEVSLPPAPEDTAVPTGNIANMAQAQAALQKEGVQLGDLLPTSSSFAAPAPVADALEDDLDFDIEMDLDEPTLVAEEPFIETAPVFAESQEPTLSLADEPPFALPEEPRPISASSGFEWEPAPAANISTPQADLEMPPLPSGVELIPPSIAESPKLLWETTEVLPAPAPFEAAPIQPLQAGMNFSNDAVLDEPELELETAPEPIAFNPVPEPLVTMDLEPEVAPAPEPEPIPAPIIPPVAPVVVAPEPEPIPTPVIPPVAPVMAAVATPAEPEPVAPAAPVAPAVNMLRVQAWQRLVGLEAATQAAQTLSDAWNLKVDLYSLLFRAADKALADTQTSLRPAKGHLEGDELQVFRVAPSQSLRGVLDSLHMSSDKGDGLAVVSLLDSAFDHVVFPGSSTLMLGHTSDQHALLSLSGDMDAAHAGALLERIAYYLERPILLV